MLGIFDNSVRAALDIWADDSRRPDTRFEDADRFRHLITSPRMNLQTLDMSGDEPFDFEMNVLIENFDQMRAGTRTLGEYPDQQYVTQHVVQYYLQSRDSCHPRVDRISARMCHQFVIYDRIILPEKTKSGRSRWAVSISLPEINIPAPVEAPTLQTRDQMILERVIHGFTTKEIAFDMEMSPKAVEHRIAALRKMYGAKSLAHLASVAVASALSK